MEANAEGTWKGRKEGRNSVRKEKKHEGTKPNSKAGN